MPIGGRVAGVARRVDLIIASIIAAGTLGLLSATLSDYGMAWDEGFTVEREQRLQEWFARITGDNSPRNRAWAPRLSKLESRSDYLRNAGLEAGSAWSRESLRFYWPFAREEPNGHPPFYALLGLAGWAATRHVLPPPSSYRFGPAALFSITVGVVYSLMARSYGRIAGVVAALGLLAMPRVFAHAHLASYDAPTLSLWFLAIAAFLRSVEPSRLGGPRWGWTLAFGIAWGCAAATKFTGWFLPFPIACWVVLYRDLSAARMLGLGALVAAAVVYALNPTWWAEPITGLKVFLVSNLTRDRLKPIPTLFFGRLYGFALPWYNTLALTMIVVPPATLGLALLGVWKVIASRWRDRVGTMLLGCWAFFMVLRALPNAPGHDGERQFLAGFVFLACLAGLGFKAIQAWLDRVATPRVARTLAIATVVLTLGAGALSTWRYHPLQLSYYNIFIGGLSGANRAGMEPTFYWDAVTPDVRAWLNEHTEPGDSVAFAFPAVTFEYLHRWALIRPATLGPSGRTPRWYVVMNRPGHLRYFPNSLGQYLLDHGRPVLVKKLNVAPDVPLIAIFGGEEALAANRILRRAETKPGAP